MAHVPSVSEEILSNDLMSCRADAVYDDLDMLDTKGVWNGPKWAEELKEHLQVSSCADVSIILLAWRAVAKAYRKELCG